MIKSLILPTVLFSSIMAFNAIAEEQAPPPLDPAYEGVHGMVLVSHSSKIYASHLPLYHKPHDYQILYKLDVKDVALVQLVRDMPMVTIKPEKFNLQRLIRGEKMALKADVYEGHFEREGTVVYEGMTLNFDKQLYVRQLKELDEPNRKQVYDVVDVSKDSKIYVHQIQKAPSYDQLLHIDQNSSCLSTIYTRDSVPDEKQTLMRFLNCGTLKPLYFETQDFKAKPKSSY